MDDKTLDFVKRLAKAMAAQFGGNCEVVVHDLNPGDPERTIAAIENGHVSRRRVGDGSSPVVLEALKRRGEHMEDELGYHTKTSDGRNELLDELIEKSVRLVGKPVAMMNKEDKVRAIRYLNDAGAMLITKSGDRISSYFGISKYTLYSYLDSGSKE